MTFGTSPVGTIQRSNSAPVKARQLMLKTFIELLGAEPTIVQYQQLDCLLDGFLWSEETYEIVKKAAEDIHREIHKEDAPWIAYTTINRNR